ncbi:MAG: aminopeptidase P family protein [candidate division Zixibacteria bacterium]|nr:aminopeptidase P family protein [candidate division Zixibacteria bacterium]
MNLQKSKISQAKKLLKELGIDIWVVFVRETPMMADPVLSLVVGHEVTWQSFFVFTSGGQSIALVGNFDKDNFVRSGCFDKVLTYTQSVKEQFVDLITEQDPQKIALNYSTSDSASDGLTHGMFMLISEYLEGTSYDSRIISAEEIVSKLRSRKLPEEITLLKKAAGIASEIWEEVSDEIKIGLTEKEVAAIIDSKIKDRGCTNSFDTLVNAGDKTEPGHGLPTDAKIEKGDLVHIDFGVLYQNFCSDIQRLLYFNRPNESSPPAELIDAFITVRDIITETGKECRPGKKGYEIDQMARKILTDHGYPEYEHALGHQLGRSVHDGGAILGPKWERYGKTPAMPLEKNNVFTLELEIILPGIGCVGLEEDMCITDEGAEFLCNRQKELIVR